MHLKSLAENPQRNIVSHNAIKDDLFLKEIAFKKYISQYFTNTLFTGIFVFSVTA